MGYKFHYVSVITAMTLFTGCNIHIGGNDSTISGIGIDGYISGATVCADVNNNGLCDANEASTTTKSDGTFTLKGRDVDSSTLILTGGVDVGTDLPFAGKLKAPAGYKVVSALTTMIQTLVSQGDSLENAESILKNNLEISNNIDLKNYDPIAEVLNDPFNDDAKKVLLEQSKIQILIEVVNNTIEGLVQTSEKNSLIDSTFKKLAMLIKEGKDLNDVTIIENLLKDAASDAMTGLPASEKSAKLLTLDNISNSIVQKVNEVLMEIKKRVIQATDTSVIEIVDAGLNIALGEVSNRAKEAAQNGDATNLSNIKIFAKMNQFVVEKSDKVTDSLYNIEFTPIDVPLTENEQDTIQSSSNVTVNGVSQDISFDILKATGDSDNGEIFGLVKDYQDNPLTFADGTPYICNGTNSGVGSGLDHSTILQRNGKLYMVNQFECSIGALYMFELEQDSSSGKLTAKPNSLQYVSQKNEFGGFTHCAGMPTPWQSHLGSEEYEPDAKTIGLGIADTYYDEVNKYWGGDASKNSPYFYGWSPEIKISNEGTPQYTKHYAMGRFSHEVSYVMPDRKTIYMSDDDTNVGLYMFIADKEEDLTSGTLYAAKFTQLDAFQGGNFNLEWIDLGHATDSEIKQQVSKQLSFTDIFDQVELNDDNTCQAGYTAINTRTGAECLKVKDGMEKIASRFETRRYASMMGATTELRKEEGVTYDPIHNKLYIAISEIARGMEENQKYGADNDSYDKAGHNHINLPDNVCGGVYALDLAKDESKNSDYIAKNFYAILVGEPKDYEGTTYAGNSCDVNNIASPDNVTYVANSNVLVIGEDTSGHKNNMVWAYNVETGKLDRTMAVPSGAEATSPYWYKDVRGFSYQTLVTQHPSVGSKQSSIGVLGPIKDASKNVVLLEEPTDIKVPDYSIPGSGDLEDDAKPCYTTEDGLVFKSNFECKSLLPWGTYSTASNADWEVATYGGKYYAYISGYGADEAANDWLISPKFQLSGDEVLTFKSAKGYSGPDLQLLVSEDYVGSGDPELATWTELDATWANTDSGNYRWTSSGNINLSAYAGKTVYFAFRQIANGTASGQVANWEIDDFIVSGSGNVVIPFNSEITLSKIENITTATELTFNPTVLGGQRPLSYNWNFGTGDTSTEQSPVYTFKNAGDYTVTLTVTDYVGNKAISKVDVSVVEPLNEAVPAKIGDLRIATYNSYLNRTTLGGLKADLESKTDSQIKNVAEIIQRVNPDILLLQEFDYYGNEQVQTFINDYLNVPQKADTVGVNYPYFYTATVNTGTQPDPLVDFNNDGVYGGADDAYGFGEFEGQYGMVLLSKYPIDVANIRTFQKFLWKDMPNANIPKNIDGTDYYDSNELNIFRLSSKSHWDIPVNVNGTIINVLASHPTPPTFDDGDTDGKNDNESNNVIDWNGKRNHDEIRLWADFIANNAEYLYDDSGVTGGLNADTRFVILGDQNADSNEGDAYDGAINQLLTSSMVNATTPVSQGAVEDGLDADDTANWGLRADYLLPSNYGFKVDQSAVFWPRKGDIKHHLIEKTGSSENSSDHRLVWADLSFVDGNASNNAITSIDENFNGSLNNWSSVSGASNKDWGASSYGGVTFAKMNGYGADEASNDWLISPKIEFAGNQALTFETAKGYSGPDLTVLISTDYDGIGNPADATWKELNATFSSGSYTWTPSGNIDLSSYSSQGYIAFHYTSTGTASGEAATWEVTNIQLKTK